MKYSRLIIVSLCMLLSLQCRKDPGFLFEFHYQHQFTLEPSFSSFNTHFFIFRSVGTGTGNFFAQYGLPPDAANGIRPADAVLSPVFSNSNLSFIEDIEVGFFTNNPDDPNDFQLAFYRENIQTVNNGDLDLFASLLDLRDILSEENYNLAVKVKLYSPPPSFLDCRLEMDFGVEE